jgi:tRNA pseudouridine32 synthase/23S rRNA pseudouridine746 synthase
MSDKIIVFKKSLREGDPLVLIDYLEKYSGLSKSTLKKILNNGGVSARRFTNSKLQRVRKATLELTLESLVEFHYDPKFLNMVVPVATELTKFREWGIWYKPPGLMSQGNEFGDNASIMRQVEKAHMHNAWLIHRLDREASGLMIFAYNPKAAHKLSEIFQKRQVRKFYTVEVLGVVKWNEGEVDKQLDNKDARTSFKVIERGEHTTKLEVEIHTGRLHQIRRHMDMIGHPVLGDPKYGVGNKNTEGMKLVASRLLFTDPFTEKPIDFSLPASYFLETAKGEKA